MSEELLYVRPVADMGDDALERDRSFVDGKHPSARVPHIGHAVLFVSFVGLLLLLSQLVLLSLLQRSHGAHFSAQAMLQPKWELASMSATYVLGLAVCFLVFPLLWNRGFLAGLDWNGAKAVRLALRLISLGLSVGWSVQALSSLVPMPKSIPMDSFFRTPSDVWLVTLFGTLLAPLFEEVAFRGFLLPAFSIAFDWIGPILRYLATYSLARLGGRLPPIQVLSLQEPASAGLARDTGNLFFRSRSAVVLATLLSSALFARLHAEQLGHALPAVGILFGVSLLLSLVRIKTQSLACSTIVHASYNLSVFVTLFLATGGYRHLEKLGR